MTNNNAIMLTTFHSQKRLKERRGLKNEKTLEKNVRLARTRGKSATEYSSWEKDYLLKCVGKDRRAVAYDGYCYIFGENDICITAFKLPKWFGKKKHFDGKIRIRNVKKYTKNYIFKEQFCCI